MASFRDVSKQFRSQWKHPTPVPTVVRIWKIYCDKGHTDEFSRYKHAIERKTGFTGGNSKRRFHGTVRACTVGDSVNQQELCRSTACSLCCIIRTSFHIAKAGQRTNFGRFGAGIYTSATSSKANDYVDECGGSPFKAMLLSDVVMGRAVKMAIGDEDLTQPPAGYDSVIGEPGNDLNYDEAIVYKNEAIRPLFLVIYKH
ncbi:ADP-ribosylation [Daedalea quercina L-15889]|uniref:ADP-ribosylation n=1 Tax=Daedalea quercina L-15889 TaxID=1314783 RepID=A0A165LRJ6_9APHY|nr:ADP-ribosylation [Daedalea quercina L-15889]